MAISLTLADLKKFFTKWHSNESHKDEITRYINEYATEHDINNAIETTNNNNTSIGNLTNNINTITNILSKLTNNSKQIDNKLNDIDNTTNWNDLKLTSLLEKINLLDGQKATINYVDTEINRVAVQSNTIPKQIAIQSLITDTQTSADLNNIKDVGIYNSKSSKDSNKINNKPEGTNTSFTLVVLQHEDDEGNKGIRQLLLTSATTNDGNKIYTRNYQQGTNTWSQWYEFYGTHNTSPLQMVVQWSDGSEQTTYTLLQKGD